MKRALGQARAAAERVKRTLHDVLAAVLTFLLIVSTAIGVHANDAAPLAADPALEARVMLIADELRCLVCQNETISASQAALAVDLRRQIRTQLQQGRSAAEILDYMVQRYGAFVRYRPAFNATNALLWVGPFALLVVAAFALVKTIRRRLSASAEPGAELTAELSEDERRRLGELLARP